MLTAPSEWTIEYSMAVQEKRCSCGILSQRGMMSQCGMRHSCCSARAVVRRVRALELLGQSIAGACAGLEVVPTVAGPGVVTLRQAQESPSVPGPTRHRSGS